MNRAGRLIAFLTMGLAACPVARADEPTGPVARPFALVELFTSEGCSSCPPADKLLGEIVAKARTNHERVYPLAFHVDYWNYLGWRDPFSDAAYSRRQEDYAGAVNPHRAYTPQVIVNGREIFVGNDGGRIQQSIDKALAQPASVAVSLSIRDGDVVEYEVTGNTRGAVLHLAVVERDLVNKIPRGENAGRTLHHDNVVRAFHTVALSDASTGRIAIALPRSANREHASVIGYVQDAKSRAILGASGIDLVR